MTNVDKVVFLKNPNQILERLIKNFVKESEFNQRAPLDQGLYWDEPLVGFASGMDPLFLEYKTLIGPFHQTPRGDRCLRLERERSRPSSLRDRPDQCHLVDPPCCGRDPERVTARRNNSPSKLWAYTKDFGEACNNALRRQVTSFLENMGHLAVAPALLPSFKSLRDEKAGWASSWSERHIAYACGLGTFSLNDGFITPKGMAMRAGSVVTLLKLIPSEKRYRHPKENCLFFRNETCGKCITRCPAGAVTENGHDKDKCREYIGSKPLHEKRLEYGLQNPTTSCGLCQTGVPWPSLQSPRPNLIA